MINDNFFTLKFLGFLFRKLQIFITSMNKSESESENRNLTDHYYSSLLLTINYIGFVITGDLLYFNSLSKK